MISLNQDFRDRLSCLNSSGVRYLILGGYAVNFHGHHRNTKDLDIWLALEAENAQRLSEALHQFGFSQASVPASKFLDAKAVFAFGRAPFRVDLLFSPSGVEFEGCYTRRVEAELDGVRVPFISAQDLHVNKLASARLRDLADIENLELQAKRPSEEPQKATGTSARRRRKK